ncbi:response regulator transcription factor [Nonomuraea sp. NPDC046570]|uniref:response regulator transcription factor n=1 Tax=Nonomuraea sp. NPDC046570 TaxID=3155255 RepID=UPI0033C158C7
MRFLICDDHKVFADSLALLIERSGWQVVGIAADPGHAAGLLSEGGVDVCLMDLSFPSGSALDRLPELCEQSPGTKFVVLTGFADAATLDAVMAAGAHGVAHKGNEVSDLLDLLRTVIAGGKVVQPALLSMSAHRAPSSQSTARRLASFLTSREREVLCSLVRGANVVSLAKELGVARSTARSHVQSVLTKLGVHSQREAVIVAARHGLVSVDTGEWLAD